MAKSKAEKIVDVWIKYCNYLMLNGIDLKAVTMRTNAIAKTHSLVNTPPHTGNK